MVVVVRDILGIYTEIADGDVVFIDGQISYEVDGNERTVPFNDVVCIEKGNK